MFAIMKAIMDLELNKNGVFLNGNYSLLNELLQRYKPISKLIFVKLVE